LIDELDRFNHPEGYIAKIKCVRDFSKMLFRLKLLYHPAGLRESRMFVDERKK